MQLSDVFGDTDAINEAYNEMKFNEYLEKLSKLPKWAKKKHEEMLKKNDDRDFSWLCSLIERGGYEPDDF